MAQLLGELSETERRIVEGVEIEGRSETEIAAELGMSQQPVSRHKSKAMKTLSLKSNEYAWGVSAARCDLVPKHPDTERSEHEATYPYRSRTVSSTGLASARFAGV